MGLEIRGGKKYYYRSRRENGRVIKEYVGCGAAAEEAARADAEVRQQIRELLQIEKRLRQLRKEEAREFEARMHARGYHRPNRGRWRKKRLPKDAAPPAPLSGDA